MYLCDYKIIDLIVFPSDVYHMRIPRLDIVVEKRTRNWRRNWYFPRVWTNTQTNFGSPLTLSISYIIERFYPFKPFHLSKRIYHFISYFSLNCIIPRSNNLCRTFPSVLIILTGYFEIPFVLKKCLDGRPYFLREVELRKRNNYILSSLWFETT